MNTDASPYKGRDWSSTDDMWAQPEARNLTEQSSNLLYSGRVNKKENPMKNQQNNDDPKKPADKPVAPNPDIDGGNENPGALNPQ